MFFGDNEEDQEDNVENTEEDSNDAEPGFSKKGKKTGDGGGDGDDGADDGEDEGDEYADWGGGKGSLPNRLKNFLVDVIESAIFIIVLAILAVNVLFFTDEKSNRETGVVLGDLFPTERKEWPYCYTEQHSECPLDSELPAGHPCKKQFGDILNKPSTNESYIKPFYINAAIYLERLIFKAFCLTKEQDTYVKEAVKESDSEIHILNGTFILARFKQWLNNSIIFHFISSRKILKYMFDGMRDAEKSLIPPELSDVLSPFMIIFAVFALFLIVLYFICGIPFFLVLIGMCLNDIDDPKSEGTIIGGLLWTLITCGGFGIIPLVIYVIQFVQFLGTFIIYPLLHSAKYWKLFSKYIPIVFFCINIMIIGSSYKYFDVNMASWFIVTLFMIYIVTYRSGLFNLKDGISQWMDRKKRERNMPRSMGVTASS